MRISGRQGANETCKFQYGLPVPEGLLYHRARLEYGKDKGCGLPRRGKGWRAGRRGKTFGSGANPLLVSVRSGAPVSMPGMMDTVLNLGLNDESVESLAKASNDRRFAFDSYRRFIQMYGNVVHSVPGEAFEKVLE